MCVVCTRRAAIAGVVSVGAASIGAMAATRPAMAGTDPMYFSCSYAAYSTFAAARNKVQNSSGNDRLDAALISELKEIVRIIPVNPGFKYIVDDPPNAYATSNTIVPGTVGTVYIGLNLISSEISSRNLGGISVAGICAHECAHVYQFNSTFAKDLEDTDTKSGVLFELHADLLAGYYLKRRGWSFEMVETFANSLFGIGDYAFNNPDHHGTPQQRVSAMRQGFSAAMQNMTLDRCALESVAFVKGLSGRRPLRRG